MPNSSPLLDQLPDGPLLAVLTRWTSFLCLQNLRPTCKRINGLLSSDAHRAARASEGIVDRALVLVSESGDGRVVYHALVGGNWKKVPWKNCTCPGEDTVVVGSAGGEHVLFTGDSRPPQLVHVTTGRREILPGPLAGVVRPAVCHLGDRTILAGGLDPDDADSRRVEMFDPSSNAWLSLPDMPRAVHGAVAGVIDRKVYVTNGDSMRYFLTGNVQPTVLQVYDTVTETWGLGPAMPEYLYHASSAVANDTLYIVGRSGATSYECLYFRPESMEWKYTASLGPFAIGCDSCHAVSRDGSLWVLYENRETSSRWLQLGDGGEWSEVSSAIAPKIPDHLTGLREIQAVIWADLRS